MPQRAIRFTWRPRGFLFAAAAEELIEAAVRDLGLGDRVARVHVAVAARPQGESARVEWGGRSRLRVTLRLDAGNFLTPAGRRAGPARGGLAGVPPRRLSRRTLAATLYHELGHVADDVLLGVHPAGVTGRRRPAFNEAWNVWLDGRLARRGRPGVPRAERWRHFLSTFPPPPGAGPGAGDRRREFAALWRAGRLSRAELEAAARRLDA